ncbi:hypothetical protein [Sphingomonas sp. dw_22]|uniref:hypothetical protein n=1 Tax=Sphingomonas sp. dw_22 TaxID=2721175 RepID=UPI001BD5B8A1|nr:hypothetical protein [Sphingomonas sp. dw_22]
MEAPEESNPPKINPFGFVYATLSAIIGVALLLVIWPNGGSEPSWLGTMSNEVRFALLAAIGGALGYGYKYTRRLLTEPDRQALSARDKAADTILRVFIAMQGAAIGYLVVRSNIVLPTTPVTQFSPFGVLVLGLLLGVLIDALVPDLLAKSAFLDSGPLGVRLNQIASAVGATTLDNYQGRIRAQLQTSGSSASEEIASSEGGRFRLLPSKPYTLLIWFEPGPGSEGLGETISISGGNDVETVSFAVSVDSSAAIGFDPGRQVCTFKAKKPSGRISFAFVTPTEPGAMTLWLRVTQKDRLAAVLALRGEVATLD